MGEQHKCFVTLYFVPFITELSFPDYNAGPPRSSPFTALLMLSACLGGPHHHDPLLHLPRQVRRDAEHTLH